MADNPLVPIKVHILNQQGFVWNADDAKRLRFEHRIVGAMVGGVARFKQQNVVHGLPMQLCAEEVTLALQHGWIELETPLSRVQGQPYAKRRRHNPGAVPVDQGTGGLEFEDAENDEGTGVEEPAADAEEEPEWLQNLLKSQTVSIPLRQSASRTDVAKAANGNRSSDDCSAPAAVQWTYPNTQREQQRFAVFQDLHSQGYSLTAGSKFGSDYLAYFGEPSLYHAQFCVRVMSHAESVRPVLLAAACRTSHAARKHLLVASVQPNGTVSYITLAPETGFGKAEQPT